jgi:hypothetical protein
MAEIQAGTALGIDAMRDTTDAIAVMTEMTAESIIEMTVEIMIVAMTEGMIAEEIMMIVEIIVTMTVVITETTIDMDVEMTFVKGNIIFLV